MIRDLLKWVAPGLATVAGGTVLCLVLTSANVANDVATAGAAAMRHAGYQWAELSFDMRDVVITGTTTDSTLGDDAVARLSALPGIRSVHSRLTLAPQASPYQLVAAIDAGKIALSGAVPDAATRDDLLAAAGLSVSALELRSGMPERRAWSAGARYVIDQIDYFDQGQMSVSDLTINIEGRAASQQAYRDLLIIMRAGAPEGLQLGSVAITPPLVAPYTWQAVSDGKRIDISGFAPDDAIVERWRTADVAGLPVATGLALGSGEPDGFADLTYRLVEQLARLEYGAATIDGDSVTLTGAPPSQEVAQAVVNELESSGSIIVLEPPRIDDYWVSATLQRGGVVVFDGYAPDAATRDALAATPGADVSWLKLGRGAPDRYQSALEFGLAAFARLSEGRFSLRDNVVTLVGQARTGADYLALRETLGQGAPQGLILARSEIAAPRAETFAWSAAKAEDGTITLSGMIPNPEAEAQLRVKAGETSSGSMTYASGEPFTFLAAAETAIDLLQWLSEGEIELSGTTWLITGTPKSAIDKAAIEADFQSRGLAAAGWSMAIADPIPTIPTASPYTWSATRDADGVLTLAGHVPNQGLQRYLAVHAGDGAIDQSSVALGAPNDFVASANAALDLVLGLNAGSVTFDGSSWSVVGAADSPERRDSLLASLAAAVPSEGWTIAIEAPEPVAAVTTPYIWSATRSADGSVLIEGLVPAEALQRFIAVRAGDQVTDVSTIDPAAPAGFAEDVLAAIGVLAALDAGNVRFDGQSWLVEGQLADPAASASIDAALAAAATPAEAWQLALIAPPPAPEVPGPVAPVEVAAPVEQPTTTEEPVAGPEVVEPEATEPAVPAIDPAYAFAATRSNGQVMLSGQLPADPVLRFFAAITDGDVAAVSLAPGAPPEFLTSAELGLRAMLQLDDAQLVFADGAWSLSGTAADAGTRDAVLAAIAPDTAGAWTTSIEVAPPAEVVATVAAEPGSLPPVDVTACLAPLAEFSARNAILFQSGAAIIAAESAAALDELAADLSACPDAVVHIEGHTDADGDEQLNLALSVARAEAVVDALIERAVNPARLYAVGYGESRPIADNDTAAGKRLNRRIVVTVSDQHF